MTISISTANYAPKNKKAEVDGVVLIARPMTSASSLAALDLQAEAKRLKEDDAQSVDRARELIIKSREQIMAQFVNREDAERVFANVETPAVTQIYKRIIEDGDEA